MKRRTTILLAGTLSPVLLALATAAGCAASGKSNPFDDDPGGSGGVGNTGATGGSHVGGSGAFDPGGGGGGEGGGGGGVIVDPCASECGPVEICDSPHNGLDDDCDGRVDEDCACTTGAVQSCFKGDPSYRNAPGCFPGTQHCNEFGFWSECSGGVHAVSPDNCFQGTSGCHPITAVPFETVDLADGLGTFGAGAITESWSVACPTGVSPCPAVTGSNPQDDFQPLQSGEYTVTYDKTTATGSDSCTYPLFVGAPGLRVELQWEHTTSTDEVDLDLHVHRPNNTNPWGGESGNVDVCAYNNCTVDEYATFFPTGVEWFTGVNPPDPVPWSPQPFTPENTTCYNAPRGVGAEWQNWGQGCHNPRLDLDNISCDPSVTDVNSSSFCAPENINIDYPPFDVWTRIGVYYYLNWGNPDPVVHPVVKIFCDGRLAGEFGPHYATPLEWTDADSDTAFWLVADVKFIDDPCDPSACEVVPLFYDPTTNTPLVVTDTWAASNFGPPYPP